MMVRTAAPKRASAFDPPQLLDCVAVVGGVLLRARRLALRVRLRLEQPRVLRLERLDALAHRRVPAPLGKAPH